MKSNLHMHSKYSDGTMWPAEIAARASKFGLEMISLTDHDTMEGVDEFVEACDRFGIKAIAGIEIDCSAAEINYDSELLGYFPGCKYDETSKFYKRRLIDRENRIKRFIIDASEYFDVSLTFEELKKFKIGFQNSSIDKMIVSYSKPDLFEFLKERGVLDGSMGYKQFKKYDFLKESKSEKPTVKETIEMILKDGGYPVLPHPGHIWNDDPSLMKNSEVDKLFSYFNEQKLWGVELYFYGNSSVNEKINKLVVKYADKYGFHLTYGSDCHGRGHKKDTLEKFYGEFFGFKEKS